jgi:hypothetical protein
MRIDLNKTLVGADFELFITDSAGNFISAIPLIEGTKHEPQVVNPMGHAIQHDGVLFEANVPPVLLTNSEDMWSNIKYVIEEGQQRLPKEYKITCCPNGSFKEDQLDHPEAKESGCTPDFSAWLDGEINEKPDLEQTAKRCCGLHWHFSFPGATVHNVMRLIRILDVNVAIPMLFIDEDKERRDLYGKAGCFRFKDYGSTAGVEYRTLSNSVIKNKEIFDFVWAQLVKSVNDYNKGIDYLPFGDKIQEAINTYNLDIATEIVEEFGVNTLEVTVG